MKAIILAAGRGSRMKNLTDDRPKCLVEFRGKALLDWQITALTTAGISEIGIVTGYKKELLENRKLKEFYNDRWAETNMVSSLECASAWLEDEECIVSYSDLFYESAAVNSLIKSQAELAITYDPNWRKLWEKRFENPLDDAETFKIDDKSYLIEIGGKTKNIEDIQGQYMGLLKITPNGWEKISELRKTLSSATRDKMHMTGTLQKLIESNAVKILAVPYTSEWGEFDNPEDIKAGI